MSKVKVKRKQTLGEEIANAVSHGIGALLGIAGTAVLIVYAAIYSDVWGIVSAALYGGTLILLYTFSTLYHSITHTKAKGVLQIFDHCSIFLLIFGTYIPVCLSLMRNWLGWVLFGINAACAVIGVVLNSIDIQKFKKFSMVLYIVMGWSVLMMAQPVFKKLDILGGTFLVIGGILYTLGIIFYKSKRKYMHFIWHFFVLGGSIFHYFFVMITCL
ncbi:MAG: hemolysin III family protein [Acutalibacteraceae bacterium]|nr:hemolysin III family protein [Acutalibacteraceae bacterium]